MIIALILLLGIDIAVIAWLTWKKTKADPKPKLKELPSFTKEPLCVTCGGPATEPVEVFMNVDLALGKRLPVTIKICQKCVADA